MPIFDQYEVESITTYSGSYTDDVIINNPKLETNQNILGLKIASKTSGLSNAINLINFSYLQRLNFISGSAEGKKTQNLYSQFFSNESYYDSLPPDIVKLNLIDCNIPSFGSSIVDNSNFGFLSNSSILNRSSIPNTNTPIIFAPKGSKGLFSSNPSKEFINFDWKEGPWAFSSKYKKIPRLEKFVYNINYPIISTTKSLDGTITTETTCTHLGSFYWALPNGQSVQNVVTNPVIFATSGSNYANLFFEHINMPAGTDIRNIIYNTAIGDNVNGASVPDIYVSIGENYTLSYSFNGIKWFPLCGQITNDVAFNTTTGIGAGQSYNISYSVEGVGDTNPGRHKRYIIVDTRSGINPYGGLIIQNVSKKIPSVNTVSDWTYYSTLTLLTTPGGIISSLPAGTTALSFNSVAFNDPYGYMASADGRFCMIGTRNGNLPLIVLADRNASATVGAMTYIAPPVNLPSLPRLNDVTISLTTTATSARWIACGDNGTIIHSSDNTGVGAWVNVSVIGPGATGDALRTIASRPLSSTSSTIIVAGANGSAYRATKDNAGNITAFASIASLPTGVTWKKVIPVKRNDSNIQWFLVGYTGTSFNPTSTDQPLIYYSTNDGITWLEFADKSTNWSGKFKEWAHNPDGNFPFFCGIASAPNAGSTPSSINNGYETIPTILLGGDNIWSYNNIGSSSPVLAKISDVETTYSSSQIYSRYFETKNCSFNTAQQLRPITGLLEREAYYHKNIIPEVDVPFKHFYGFGNGITFQFGNTPYGGFADTTNKFPGILTIENAPGNLCWDIYDGWEERGPETVKIYGGILRGWHYGLYSGIKLNTKQIYRRGRFGQLRDILEGRVTAATITSQGKDPYGNPIRRTVFYPVNVTFITGSEIYNQAKDYVSATNPSYNPYDSGIYDYHYRSGQPFTDR